MRKNDDLEELKREFRKLAKIAVDLAEGGSDYEELYEITYQHGLTDCDGFWVYTEENV